MSNAQIHKSGTTNLTFPAIYSTLACDALASRLLPHYEIEVVAGCQFWHRGLSDIYLVETQAKPYILRVSHHHWRSKSEIDFELELLDFLRQNQIPVAYPLPTKAGELSVEINAPEGKRYAALFPYAPGEVPLGDLNASQSHKLGKTLAKLHQVAQDFRSSSDRQALTLEYLLDDSWHQIAPWLQQKESDRIYLAETIALIKDSLRDLPCEPPYWGICWGDPHSGNTHFTADNQITLFDFDQCGYGWRIFDIAKFWQVSLRTGMPRQVRETFLAGYQELAKIKDFELQALQALTQAAHIWMWAISLNSAMIYDRSRLDDYFFRRRIEHLRLLNTQDWQLF
ncbi:MAG: phosphotransferase [Oscillatoria sp. SIO1A7]|nr:phosphotransferase [Oscillatoria sp. SIO1A7]